MSVRSHRAWTPTEDKVLRSLLLECPCGNKSEKLRFVVQRDRLPGRTSEAVRNRIDRLGWWSIGGESPVQKSWWSTEEDMILRELLPECPRGNERDKVSFIVQSGRLPGRTSEAVRCRIQHVGWWNLCVGASLQKPWRAEEERILMETLIRAPAGGVRVRSDYVYRTGVLPGRSADAIRSRIEQLFSSVESQVLKRGPSRASKHWSNRELSKLRQFVAEHAGEPARHIARKIVSAGILNRSVEAVGKAVADVKQSFPPDKIALTKAGISAPMITKSQRPFRIGDWNENELRIINDLLVEVREGRIKNHAFAVQNAKSRGLLPNRTVASITHKLWESRSRIYQKDTSNALLVPKRTDKKRSVAAFIETSEHKVPQRDAPPAVEPTVGPPEVVVSAKPTPDSRPLIRIIGILDKAHQAHIATDEWQRLIASARVEVEQLCADIAQVQQEAERVWEAHKKILLMQSAYEKFKRWMEAGGEKEWDEKQKKIADAICAEMDEVHQVFESERIARQELRRSD